MPTTAEQQYQQDLIRQALARAQIAQQSNAANAQAQAAMYGADRAVDATKYNADSNLTGTKDTNQSRLAGVTLEQQGMTGRTSMEQAGATDRANINIRPQMGALASSDRRYDLERGDKFNTPDAVTNQFKMQVLREALGVPADSASGINTASNSGMSGATVNGVPVRSNAPQSASPQDSRTRGDAYVTPGATGSYKPTGMKGIDGTMLKPGEWQAQAKSHWGPDQERRFQSLAEDVKPQYHDELQANITRADFPILRGGSESMDPKAAVIQAIMREKTGSSDRGIAGDQDVADLFKSPSGVSKSYNPYDTYNPNAPIDSSRPSTPPVMTRLDALPASPPNQAASQPGYSLRDRVLEGAGFGDPAAMQQRALNAKLEEALYNQALAGNKNAQAALRAKGVNIPEGVYSDPAAEMKQRGAAVSATDVGITATAEPDVQKLAEYIGGLSGYVSAANKEAITNKINALITDANKAGYDKPAIDAFKKTLRNRLDLAVARSGIVSSLKALPGVLDEALK